MKQYTLAHHGVLGQKWGVRRYQNEDGSLTPAGEKKYNVNTDGKLEKKEKSFSKAKTFNNLPYNEVDVSSKGTGERFARSMLLKPKYAQATTKTITKDIGKNLAITAATFLAGIGILAGFAASQAKNSRF